MEFNGITIQNGTANLGGGIRNDGGTLSITNSVVKGNTATENGGGIENFKGAITITNSMIRDNSAADDGGGIKNDTHDGIPGTITITNSNVSGNSALCGGGIDNDDILTIVNSTVGPDPNDQTTQGNTAGNCPAGPGGGGIRNSEDTTNDGLLAIMNSIIASNTSPAGGGISNAGPGMMAITNSTISANEATSSSGGGISNTGPGTVMITASTISENKSTSSSGGGMQNAGPGAMTITDSTISANEATSSSGGGIQNESGSNLTITGSTLSDNAAVRGGGIRNEGDLTITNSALSGNEAKRFGGGITGLGGGISNVDGTAELVDTAVSSNEADDGGGIHNAGELTLNTSTVSDNTAGRAGGILNSSLGGTVLVDKSTISGNEADIGAGILNFDLLELNSSTISDNTGTFGGGIHNATPGRATVTNSTVSGNEVDLDGGGVLNSGGGMMTVLSSTVSSNKAQRFGGGVFNQGNAELQNTILANNMDGANPDCFGLITSLGNNLIGTISPPCDITLQPSDLTGDPGLDVFMDDGSPGNGHFPLLPTSQVIDMGNNAACPPSDQLGRPRFDGDENGTTICDIGAIEFPVPEEDNFPNTGALVGIRLPGGSVMNVILNGPAMVEVDIGPNGEAVDSDGDGLDQVNTELVSLDLMGSGFALRIRDAAKDPFRRSTGEIEETVNNQSGRLDVPPFLTTGPGTANSFFDVFFEIDVPSVGTLHNHDPLRIEAIISQKPPVGTRYFHPEDIDIELFTENDDPTGARIVTARHEIPIPDTPEFPFLPDTDFTPPSCELSVSEGVLMVTVQDVESGLKTIKVIVMNAIHLWTQGPQSHDFSRWEARRCSSFRCQRKMQRNQLSSSLKSGMSLVISPPVTQ